jgi:hypothetical protein
MPRQLCKTESSLELIHALGRVLEFMCDARILDSRPLRRRSRSSAGLAMTASGGSEQQPPAADSGVEQLTARISLAPCRSELVPPPVYGQPFRCQAEER